MIALWLACAVAPRPENPLETIERLTVDPVAGEVVEVVAAGDYAYVRLHPSSGGDVWVAGFDKRLVVGDVARARRFGRATAFHSARTARTFDEVWFAVVEPIAPPG